MWLDTDIFGIKPLLIHRRYLLYINSILKDFQPVLLVTYVINLRPELRLLPTTLNFTTIATIVKIWKYFEYLLINGSEHVFGTSLTSVN